MWLLTTCGEYDGGASNGWCDPDSCVTTCSDFANCGWQCSYGGDAMDCYEYGQCVTCGDDTCVVGIETRANCAADCGYCGDGICQYLDEVMTSQPNWCEQDCGLFDPLSGEDPDCDPIDGNPACEGAMVCTPRGVCEPVAYGGGGGGLCYNNGDCATHYKCLTLVFNDIENGAGLCVYNPSPLAPVSTPTSR